MKRTTKTSKTIHSAETLRAVAMTIYRLNLHGSAYKVETGRILEGWRGLKEIADARKLEGKAPNEALTAAMKAVQDLLDADDAARRAA